MGDYKTRLLKEFAELQDRTNKLIAFSVSPKINELPEVDRQDLQEQLIHMQAYLNVLNRRVSRLAT